MNLAAVDEQLFFIIGCARSGTTLVQSMITRHPEVVVPDETGFYTMLYADNVPRWGELSEPDAFAQALEATLNRYRIKDLKLDTEVVRAKCRTGKPSWETLFLAILATFAEQHGARRVGEKSPGHLRYLGLLKDRFPHAQFLHVIRDPRAVVLSLSKVSFGSRHLGVLCERWRAAIQTHLAYGTLLGPQRYQVIKYEDLVTAPADTVQVLCAFLHLTFSPDMLEPHKREHLGFNKRYWAHMQNTLKPVFTSSVDKWKSELTASQIARIQHVLRDEMALMEYDPIPATTLFPGVQHKLDVLMDDAERKGRRFKKHVRRIVRRVHKKRT